MVAEQYERVIKLAQRAMELERELDAVRRELASSGIAPVSSGASVGGVSSSRAPIPIDEDLPEVGLVNDDDLSASLAKQMLAIYKNHPDRSLTSEQIAKSLGIADPDKINMLRSYAVRFSKGKKPKLRKTKRGYYQYVRS